IEMEEPPAGRLPCMGPPTARLEPRQARKGATVEESGCGGPFPLCGSTNPLEPVRRCAQAPDGARVARIVRQTAESAIGTSMPASERRHFLAPRFDLGLRARSSAWSELRERRGLWRDLGQGLLLAATTLPLSLLLAALAGAPASSGLLSAVIGSVACVF